MSRIMSILISNKKRIINLAIYFLGLFALKGASLILTPLYTKVFSTAEYGIIELANSVVSFLSIIVGLGLCQYLGVEYFHFLGDERETAILKNIKQYVTLAGLLSVIAALAIVLKIISINGLSTLMMLLIVSASFLAYFSSLCLMLCKNQQKTTMMTMLQLVVGLMTLIMNYLGVCIWKWGIYSTLITTTLSHIVLLLAIPKVFDFHRKIREVKINPVEMRKVLRISIPLALTSLINSVLVLGDRWVLNYFCSPSEIGIYALATKFSGIFGLLLVNTLTIFYSPVVYQSYQSIGIREYERKNRKHFNVYIIVSIVAMSIFLATVKWFFPIFIDNKYTDSLKYLWIVLLGEVFLGATYFRTYLLNYKKKTKYILLINVVATFVNIATNFMFIPKYQVYAAAGTTAASQILMFIMATIINEREYKNSQT